MFENLNSKVILNQRKCLVTYAFPMHIMGRNREIVELTVRRLIRQVHPLFFYCFLNCIFLFCLRLCILACENSFHCRSCLNRFFFSLARCLFLYCTLCKTYPYRSFHNCTSMYPQHCNRILPLLALLFY